MFKVGWKFPMKALSKAVFPTCPGAVKKDDFLYKVGLNPVCYTALQSDCFSKI